MAKFVIVDKVPDELRKDEFAITQPTFLEEIKENASKAPKNNRTATNHLRYIVGTIGQKYDANLTAWTVRPHLYEGREFQNDEQLSAIVLEMLQQQYPQIFEAYLQHKIKTRPSGTKLIYYVGSFQSTTPFYQNGIDLLEQKDIEPYMTGKPKKTVGKPAVTSEE